jgi:hypothetical protein
VKDGVVRESGFEALCAKEFFPGVPVMILQSQFINIRSL